MNAFVHRRRSLCALIAAIMLLALTATAAPATHAQASKPDWIAWNLKIDFPGTSTRAILTIYEGKNTTPVEIIDESQYDISSNCQTFGGLTISGGAATFAGQGYIRCELPMVLISTCDRCAAQMSPFYWFSSRVKIDAGSASNPIAELTNAGNTSTAQFSLPRSGNKAATQLVLPGGSYRSSLWNISASDNRVIVGTNGPAIIDIASKFKNSNWLSFLTAPNWQTYLNTVPASRVGSWSEPQMVGWQTNRATEQWPDAHYVYIGHSPSNGTYFNGKMWNVEIDPGCTAK